jgi:hypothetical protein
LLNTRPELHNIVPAKVKRQIAFLLVSGIGTKLIKEVLSGVKVPNLFVKV